MNYSHGIWVSVNPVTTYNFPNVRELPPLNEAFTQFDYPDGMEVQEVRGHVAWTVDLKRITCEVGNAPNSSATPNGTRKPSPPTAAEPVPLIYDPTTTASIEWLENGVVVNVVGPFSASQLKEVASGIRWL